MCNFNEKVLCMNKLFLNVAIMLGLMFGSCVQSQNQMTQQSMEYNKRILWALGSAMGMGLVSKAIKTPFGNTVASKINYTSDEVDFVTSVSGVLSVMRIVDDSPITRRWTAGLWLTMIGYKLWSSYWMQDLLNVGAGALGQSIFPQKDIETTKENYKKFNQYSYDLKQVDLSKLDEENQKKLDFVNDYSYRKRSGLATAVMTVALVTPTLELFYYGCQKYLHVNMGVAF
jgi:hypothetical protein